MSNDFKNVSHIRKLKIVGLLKRKLGDELVPEGQHSQSEQTIDFVSKAWQMKISQEPENNK